jgi:excisionase family DNA binding protein
LRQELDRFLDDRSVEQLLSIGGVAEALNVSERTVERLVDDGELTPIWIRGQRRFKPESVRSYIRRAAGGSA